MTNGRRDFIKKSITSVVGIGLLPHSRNLEAKISTEELKELFSFFAEAYNVTDYHNNDGMAYSIDLGVSHSKGFEDPIKKKYFNIRYEDHTTSPTYVSVHPVGLKENVKNEIEHRNLGSNVLQISRKDGKDFSLSELIEDIDKSEGRYNIMLFSFIDVNRSEIPEEYKLKALLIDSKGYFKTLKLVEKFDKDKHKYIFRIIGS